MWRLLWRWRWNYNNSSSDEQFKLPVKKRGRRPDWPKEMEENLVDIILSDEKWISTFLINTINIFFSQGRTFFQNNKSDVKNVVKIEFNSEKILNSIISFRNDPPFIYSVSLMTLHSMIPFPKWPSNRTFLTLMTLHSLILFPKWPCNRTYKTSRYYFLTFSLANYTF